MDGTLAIIFILASTGDMVLNHCGRGCLGSADAPARLSFHAAAVEFQGEVIGEELLLGYDLPQTFGPWQPAVALSATDTGDIWIGAGARWTSQGFWDSPLYLDASFMPGVHFQGDGPDLGGSLHFRASLGVGYEFAGGVTATLSYDHRSNADRLALNPGLETISLRVSVPIGQ